MLTVLVSFLLLYHISRLFIKEKRLILEVQSVPVSPIAAKPFTSWLENKTEERESHLGSIVLFKSKHLVPPKLPTRLHPLKVP